MIITHSNGLFQLLEDAEKSITEANVDVDDHDENEGRFVII